MDMFCVLTPVGIYWVISKNWENLKPQYFFRWPLQFVYSYRFYSICPKAGMILVIIPGRGLTNLQDKLFQLYGR